MPKGRDGFTRRDARHKSETTDERRNQGLGMPVGGRLLPRHSEMTSETGLQAAPRLLVASPQLLVASPPVVSLLCVATRGGIGIG